MNDKERQIKFLEVLEVMNSVVSDDILTWLVNQGFFVKPGSISHHENYSGGLFDHSLAVTENLLEMTEKLDIKWSRPESPYIVGMFHDLCKLDDYYDRSAKDIVLMGTGSPVSKNPEWDYNSNKMMTGHGDKSVMLLSQFINLTEEEMLCIRFHMGAYNTDDWDFYDRAIRKYETVLWTHTADMYASKVQDGSR